MQKLAARLLAAFVALSGSQGALAQGPDYPAGLVKIIVPFAPGGAADVRARLVGERLHEAWKTPVIIENRPGAGSNTGADALAKSAPDGYTIGLGDVASHAINPAVYGEGMPFDPEKDLAALTMLAITPNVLVVNVEKIKAASVPELVALLKANPGKFNYGSSGVGTTLHVGMELFAQMTGTQVTHVPYRGSGPMLQDLISGQLDLALDGALTAWPHVQSGKLRALAVSTPERAFFAAELSTLSEFTPGLEVIAWHGFFAPAKTPADRMAKIASELQRILSSPDMAERIRAQTAIPMPMTPADFSAFIARDRARWAGVVKAANIKVQ
jgi:tripartite-type tricarboxylate transporter receptor subunit TctC